VLRASKFRQGGDIGMSKSLLEAAHYFEKVFRESNEYKSLQKVCNELNTDPQAKQILNQMNNLNSQLQQKQMMGQEIRQQEVEALQKMEAIAQQNEKIKRLMEADYRVNMLLMELNKIILRPMNELYSQLGGK
jgi:cell fate (sporulation/competence/biofilm development) regulator YlbF (YheA/YmcA/DUF963 family)